MNNNINLTEIDGEKVVINNLNNNSKKIPQPKGLDIKLMEHQKTSIFAMKELESSEYHNISSEKMYYDLETNSSLYSNIGVLGDKVGSGKTLMIIGLLLINNNIATKPIISTNGSRYMGIVNRNIGIKYSNVNLILIPHKLMSQWKNSFKYAPSLKVFFYDSKKAQQELKDTNIENYDVVVVPCAPTCNRMRIFSSSLKQLNWKRIIIDEADTITTASNFIFNGKFIWLMTGTPQGFRYSTKALIKNLFPTYTCRNLISEIIVKNNNNFIDESIKLPQPIKYKIECFTPVELSIKEFIPASVTHMINAGNIEDAIKALNYNEDTNENLFNILIKNNSQNIKNKKIELEAEEKKKYNGNKKEEQIEKIKKIKDSIKSIETKIERIRKKIFENDDRCPICLDNYERPVILSCCQSKYCFECLTLTMTIIKCPLCKASLKKKDINLINNDTIKNKKNSLSIIFREKIDVLMELLKRNPDGKFMVFADYVETFKKIEKELYNNNIGYIILKGTMATVNKNIENFENGKIKVILLNARHYGAGMNLQMASDIIMFHRFESNMEEQILGRAQRIGRTGQLKIHYLVHNNELIGLDDCIKINSDINQKNIKV